MKKKILLLALLLNVLNVEASAIYSDYTFLGYSTEQSVGNEHYKYEEVKLHKYYQISETNITYAPLTTLINESPYIDKNSRVEGYYYLGNRSEFGTPRPIIYMKLDESYMTKTINIINLNTNRNQIYEFEIFYKDQKINYNIDSNYSFLNDSDINSGSTITDGNFSLILDEYYDVKDIKILVHFNCSFDSISYFTVEYVNEAGESKRAAIHLDKYYEKHKTKWLELIVGEDYVNFILDNNILSEYFADTNTLREVYEYSYPLYKHYNLEKVYYMNSFDDEIEGYTYDKEEDITLYKIYGRIYLGEDKEITTNSKEENNNVFVYKALPVNNSKNAKTAHECETEDYNYECNCPKETIKQIEKKKKLYLIPIIILLFIILLIYIFKTIKNFIYKKAKR